MAAAVEEGSQLPVELKRARVNMEVSRQRLEAARLDQDYYEMMLAVVLGYPATDRVKPVDSDLPAFGAPASENEATDAALQNSRELRQMEANVLAKQLDVRSYKSASCLRLISWRNMRYLRNTITSNIFKNSRAITSRSELQ